jgi:hypothetical protein
VDLDHSGEVVGGTSCTGQKETFTGSEGLNTEGSGEKLVVKNSEGAAKPSMNFTGLKSAGYSQYRLKKLKNIKEDLIVLAKRSTFLLRKRRNYRQLTTTQT